jgi:hypothetical protein
VVRARRRDRYVKDVDGVMPEAHAVLAALTT